MRPIVQQHAAILTPTERLVLNFLEDFTARRYLDSFYSTDRIAAAVGCCRRSVQLALKRLAALGLVRVIRDLGLTSKRRIQLLWRREKTTAEPAPKPNSLGANSSPRRVSDFAPSRPVPPHPPIEESEDKEKCLSGDSEISPHSTRPETAQPVKPPPPPQDHSLSNQSNQDQAKAKRKATPEEKAELQAKAEAIFGAGPATATKAKALAKAWGLSWVLAALDRADAAKQRDGRVGWGYLARTLIGFRDDGGATPCAPAPKRQPYNPTAARMAENKAFVAKKMAELTAAREQEGSTNAGR